MSDFENEYDDAEEFTPDEDDEVDAEQYAKYKADQDNVNNTDEFRNRYGFEHNCRCAEDWAVGNLGVVAVCYLNMCRDAMETLAAIQETLAEKDQQIAELRILAADVQ